MLLRVGVLCRILYRLICCLLYTCECKIKRINHCNIGWGRESWFLLSNTPDFGEFPLPLGTYDRRYYFIVAPSGSPI